MTKNDELKTGQGLSVERVRTLLEGRTPGEWYLAINNRPCSTTTGEEEDAVLLGGPIKNRGDAEIMILAPDLAHAYLAERIISSALEVRIDDLALERDRLAHELRLLREAVGVPAWTTIPLDLARAVLKVGRAEWGVTVAQDAEAHGAMMAQSVRLTAEHFQQGDEAQAMQVVFLEGTDVVIAYTGTSPYSGTTAQGMTAAWNRLHEDCATAVAHAGFYRPPQGDYDCDCGCCSFCTKGLLPIPTPLSSDTPEWSGGEG